MKLNFEIIQANADLLEKEGFTIKDIPLHFLTDTDNAMWLIGNADLYEHNLYSYDMEKYKVNVPQKEYLEMDIEELNEDINNLQKMENSGNKSSRISYLLCRKILAEKLLSINSYSTLLSIHNIISLGKKP
jgi:hypothetical protein